MGYAGVRIKYTVRSTNCTQCGNKMGSPHRFGPTQVRCGLCGATVQTGLTEWANLSTMRKVIVAASEIIFPSWIGVSGFSGILMGIITQLFLWMVVSLPVYIPLTILMEKEPTEQNALFSLLVILLAFLIGPLLYPSLLAVRLGRLIRESQTYMRTQEPPVWGKSAKEKIPKAITMSKRYLSWQYPILLRLLALIIAVVWFQGFSEAIWGKTMGYIVLGAAHVSGVLVAFELSRCLGLTRGAYTVAILALVAPPLTLPILALMKHHAAGLIGTARKNLRLIENRRASSIEMAAYGEALELLSRERNPTAVRSLIHALKGRDGDIRETVATALGEIGDVRAVDPLIRALQDKDSGVRMAAATALGKIGDLQALEPLEKARKDQDADVGSAIVQALEELKKRREAK